MAIRYKKVYVDTNDITDEDIYKDIPIQEWEIHPRSINFNHTSGHSIPNNYSSQVTFAELWEWNDRQYYDVAFALEISFSGNIPWLKIQSDNLVNNEFTMNNIESAKLDFIFQGINHLPIGTHSATIRLKAFWNKPTGKEFIEYSPVDINIVVHVNNGTNNGGGSTGGSTSNNNYLPTRHLLLDKNTGQITGDTAFTVDITGFVNAIVFDNSDYLTVTNQSSNTFKISASSTAQNVPIGTHQGMIKIEKRSPARDELVFIPTITEVVGLQSNDFLVSPTEFTFKESKNIGQSKTVTAQLFNPNQLTISALSYPHFISSVNISNSTVSFTTVNASLLPLGVHEGFIVLKSGALQKQIKVKLEVFQNFTSELVGEPYYFALDKKKITIQPSKPEASYIVMELDMIYQGFGEFRREKQSYRFPFFNDAIELFPGEEIQDFFIRLTAINLTSIAQYQYHLAVVNLIFKEYDSNDNEITQFKLNNILFAPGKRPKCFPVYTDFKRRRTYTHSKIRLNGDMLENRFSFLGMEPMDTKNEVHAFDFNRNKFEDKKSLEIYGIHFIPFPNPDNGKVIHLFFENQNLVLDWFSCPGYFHKKYDFNHVINEDSGEKYATLETENLVLNTGWILREEIELVNAIIKSRICFIIIDGEVIKARPTSKKNEMFNAEENLFSMDLEFNIKQNER